jgi:hypothetical protein
MTSHIVEKLREKINGYAQPALNYDALHHTDVYGMPQTMVIEVSSADAGQTTLGTAYTVNMMGKYNITLTGVSVQFSTDPTFMNIAIQCPQLTIPFYVNNGVGKYPQYFNWYYPNTHENNSFKKKCYYGNKFINNQFDIKIINADTGASPTNFTSALLTFEVRKVLNE